MILESFFLGVFVVLLSSFYLWRQRRQRRQPDDVVVATIAAPADELSPTNRRRKSMAAPVQRSVVIDESDLQLLPEEVLGVGIGGTGKRVVIFC